MLGPISWFWSIYSWFLHNYKEIFRTKETLLVDLKWTFLTVETKGRHLRNIFLKRIVNNGSGRNSPSLLCSETVRSEMFPQMWRTNETSSGDHHLPLQSLYLSLNNRTRENNITYFITWKSELSKMEMDFQKRLLNCMPWKSLKIGLMPTFPLSHLDGRTG